jgi:DMSO/TMAO reductase YedYZ molybdopterin-dependent catalytic subunit
MNVVDGFSIEELQLAARNHGMPLEALRWDITPIGLHYLLTHYDIPAIDAVAWRLRVDGLVERELTLALDDLRALPTVTAPVTFECAGNGRTQITPHVVSQPWISEAVGTAEWTGTPLASLLQEAGVRDEAVEIVFTGQDHGVEYGVEQDYQRSLTVEEAREEGVLLAYAINGQPLPPQHGFPLRLVVPGWYGMTNVKWLTRITATAEPFAGYQQARGYRYRQTPDEPGTPVSRIMPRALMVPPGMPDFMTRKRIVPAGSVELAGRAWSGWGGITRVEVSTDGGDTWGDADLKKGPGPAAWSSWTFDWQADGPADVELRCRATDASGRAQPDEPPWNVGGYSNNSVQRVPVTVVGGSGS